MAWHDHDSWLTQAFSPNLSTITVTLVLVLVLPILLHLYIHRNQTPTSLPGFLLVGPSGSGKTALLTLAERTTTPASTHTSTAPFTITAHLPEGYTPASAHYRTPGDPAWERARAFLLTDTPGHGKLRHFASAQLANPTNLCGIIFVVDAAAIAEEAGLNEAAEYLHDVLLSLQKRYTSTKTSKGPKEIPVLVAANKADLFTALPPHLVKLALEKGITNVRKSRAQGVKAAGNVLGEADELEEEDAEWLGEGGEGAFEFSQMEECGVDVQVRGGNVLGSEGSDAKGWWEWIGDKL